MIHESARTGYEREADTYAKARPSYHPSLVRRFVDRFGDGVIVELGAGTGIFTSQLVDLGCTPVAVEPVAAMRTKLVADHPHLEAIDGNAESTGLADHSADCVVVAQAFHWFDLVRACEEIERVLRPGGFLVTAWNVRDELVPWVGAYTEVMDRHAGTTPRYRTMHWRDAIESWPTFGFIEEWQIDNPRPTNSDGVVDRGLSTSFIAALDPARQARVEVELRSIVADLGPSFDYPYRSEYQAWQHRPLTPGFA